MSVNHISNSKSEIGKRIIAKLLIGDSVFYSIGVRDSEMSYRCEFKGAFNPSPVLEWFYLDDFADVANGMDLKDPMDVYNIFDIVKNLNPKKEISCSSKKSIIKKTSDSLPRMGDLVFIDGIKGVAARFNDEFNHVDGKTKVSEVEEYVLWSDYIKYFGKDVDADWGQIRSFDRKLAAGYARTEKLLAASKGVCAGDTPPKSLADCEAEYISSKPISYECIDCSGSHGNEYLVVQSKGLGFGKVICRTEDKEYALRITEAFNLRLIP